MVKKKKSLKRYRISLDGDACIGCLACTRCEGIEVGEDMRAHALHAEVDDLGCCREAAKACPVGAIVITPIS
jgi:ferredoxin